MVRFTDSNVVVDDYPRRQRDNQSTNGRWSPDYLYAGGAAPPSPGGSGGAREGPYMTGPMLDPAPGHSTTTHAPPRYANDSPTATVLTRENSLQVPHWDRYRPRSVPPPMSPTTEATSMVFPPPRSRSRNHDRDRESYHERDRDRHEDRNSRRKTDRETKGRHRDRYYDPGSSSSDGDDGKSNKAAITRSRTPLSKTRQAISSTFSDSTTGLGASVIGAIVGGLAAREASENLLANKGGHGRDGGGHSHSGKEALLSTIAGAAVGALGANAIEKRIETSRKKTSSSSANSPTAAGHGSGKGSDDGRNYTWGDERRRSSQTEEKRDRANGGRDRDRDRDRDRETYRDREIRRDRSQRRGSKDDHRYYSSDDDGEVVYDYKKRRTPRDRSRPRWDDDDRRDMR